MKKIFISLALGIISFSNAQNYPNQQWDNNDYYATNGNYQNDDDFFPDDYYYNYPNDYYPEQYYQSQYNDYQNSIIQINWNSFFRKNRLSRWQINQIIQLNNLYNSFSAWDQYYRYNPDRWYYDRYFAMERILGPRIFIVFQNNYYQGYSPIQYFRNYRTSYYVPRYSCRPIYRNININRYRVDRNRFDRSNHPTFNIVRSHREQNGFRNEVNSNSGFRNSNNVQNNGFSNSNNGFRNRPQTGGERRPNTVNDNRNNGGFRNTPSSPIQSTPSGNGGFRGQKSNSAPSTTPDMPSNRSNNGGFRGNLTRR